MILLVHVCVTFHNEIAHMLALTAEKTHLHPQSLSLRGY